jgi:hypothetical protein
MQTVKLSADAVAVLRLEIKGWKARDPSRRLPAYRELAGAGIMEPVSDLEFRFTDEGMKHREAILEREAERIERERHAPPDVGELSGAARELLRRRAADEDVAVTSGNLGAYRELVAARIMIPCHSFVGGREAGFVFTYWGYRLRFEILCRTKESA